MLLNAQKTKPKHSQTRNFEHCLEHKVPMTLKLAPSFMLPFIFGFSHKDTQNKDI